MLGQWSAIAFRADHMGPTSFISGQLMLVAITCSLVLLTVQAIRFRLHVRFTVSMLIVGVLCSRVASQLLLLLCN